MKLKYLVKTDNKYLFANALDDLASYHKITLAGIRYRMKKNLINIHRIDSKLQHLDFNYTIDKNGVVIVAKTDVVDACQDTQTTTVDKKSSTCNHLRKCDVNNNETIINNNNI